MMARVTFAHALRSEAVRLRRSPIVWLHAVLATVLGGLAGAYFAFSSWDSLMGTDAFFQLLGAGAPLLAGIACGLAADAEQRAGEGANLLGVSSRRAALAAKLAALLALGLAAAAWAAVLFCTALALAGRALPEFPALALAVLGIALGSACSYAIFLLVALKWGRNASIGLGALGFIAAMALLGGLANGLVTGTLSGALGVGLAAVVPFAWPSRLATLPLEASIASGLGAAAQASALASAWTAVALVCVVATAVVLAVTLACANRFEGRRGGE
ncbi:ABC transporter permease [Eggerthella guodeyinii]|uniref:ABC transporter permease n=1 Tax=Eggerthella guodeyinii TaxID=2690837 RepID=UPI001FD31550|nr:ABC transporter permease [Eggerthella guodeyinii]